MIHTFKCMGCGKQFSALSILNNLCLKCREIETKQCVPGCICYSGNETYHHKDCPFYPDSFSKKYDKLIMKNTQLEELVQELECARRRKI